MTVKYTRKRITRTYRVEVAGDGDEELSQTTGEKVSLGYKRTLVIRQGTRWDAAYERVEVVADTARGDEVAL